MVSWRTEDGIRCPGAGVAGCTELPLMDTELRFSERRTSVLTESSLSSPLPQDLIEP